MIITVAHQKGGVGKSTIASNLAVLLGADLFDLDKQFSSALFNNTRVEAGLSKINCYTLLESECTIPNQTPINKEEWVDFLLNYAGNVEKSIVIDCPGLDCDEIRSAMFCADLILTPVAASQVEVYGLLNFEKIIEKTEETFDKPIKTHVLINNADDRAKQRTEELKDFVRSDEEHFILCKAHISRALALWDAYGKGMAVTEYNKASAKTTAEMKLLSWEIRNELGI